MSTQGKFIVIEGIEGSGKSTLSNKLKTSLEKHKQKVLLTREPGGTKTGQKIRELLLNVPEDGSVMDFNTELLLFFADRAQHINELILPTMKAGNTLICDRYFYSTLAYQHYGRGIDRNVIDSLINLVVGSVLPDLVLLVDLDPEQALKRAKSRATLDRIEKEDLAFHTRIRNGFLEIAKEQGERFYILDGTLSENDLAQAAFNAISRFITT